MLKIITIAQLVVAVLLMGGILLQQSGAGLGSAFGGGDSVYLTKRGAEKTIFTITIILAFLFLALGVANLLLAKNV
ncbi:MAG TPA: preprotein translocase subunit SecG [bacterium]|nr:preprotein translocase subunit SecG [bacterium]